MGCALRARYEAIGCKLHIFMIIPMTKSASDPIAVLRGHRTDVQALHFHPTLAILYSGCVPMRCCRQRTHPVEDLLTLVASDTIRRALSPCAGTLLAI